LRCGAIGGKAARKKGSGGWEKRERKKKVVEGVPKEKKSEQVEKGAGLGLRPSGFKGIRASPVEEVKGGGQGRKIHPRRHYRGQLITNIVLKAKLARHHKGENKSGKGQGKRKGEQEDDGLPLTESLLTKISIGRKHITVFDEVRWIGAWGKKGRGVVLEKLGKEKKEKSQS